MRQYIVQCIVDLPRCPLRQLVCIVAANITPGIKELCFYSFIRGAIRAEEKAFADMKEAFQPKAKSSDLCAVFLLGSFDNESNTFCILFFKRSIIEDKQC